MFTDDQFPRAVNVDGTLKSAEDWDAAGVTVLDCASIGARSGCIAPVTIGRWTLVGGPERCVVQDVPDFALAVGSPGPPKKVGAAAALCVSAKTPGTGGIPRQKR